MTCYPILESMTDPKTWDKRPSDHNRLAMREEFEDLPRELEEKSIVVGSDNEGEIK